MDTSHAVTTDDRPERGEFHQGHSVTFSGVIFRNYALVGLGDSNCVQVRPVCRLCWEAGVVRTSTIVRRSCARPRLRRDLTLISEMARILAVSEMLQSRRSRRTT